MKKRTVMKTAGAMALAAGVILGTTGCYPHTPDSIRADAVAECNKNNCLTIDMKTHVNKADEIYRNERDAHKEIRLGFNSVFVADEDTIYGAKRAHEYLKKVHSKTDEIVEKKVADEKVVGE